LTNHKKSNRMKLGVDYTSDLYLILP